MAANKRSALAPPLPQPVLSIGVTGHRSSHPSFPADPASLDAAIQDCLEVIEREAKAAQIDGLSDPNQRFRLVTLLADGTDHLAADAALAREWEVAAPLPFGSDLNRAINAQPKDAADARTMLSGKVPSDPACASRADAIRELSNQAIKFELAEQDAEIERCFLATLDAPQDSDLAAAFIHQASQRAGLAGRILIEQSDVLIAVWDGQSTIHSGGTGHTASLALEAGVPVIWIDPAEPENIRILHFPEALQAPGNPMEKAQFETELRSIVTASIGLVPADLSGRFAGLEALAPQIWRESSSFLSHAYRRVEALFGEHSWGRKLRSIKERYERPDRIAEGSAADLVAELKGIESGGAPIHAKAASEVLPHFAWTNAIASMTADRYRSGMVWNFVLGAMAIISGVLYLPLVDTSQKWMFAAVELAILLAIVVNTVSGQRARLHGRWLETRRAAEYLRHLPMLYAFGVARPLGDWPNALRSQWPEWYARMIARGLGLPSVRIDHQHLRIAARVLQDRFVVPQRDYHLSKARRLHKAHHSIEWLAERLFALAIAIVASYLALSGAAALGFVDPAVTKGLAKWFTVVAVALPTISGALAAIGYFGDFERFADISQAAAQKLDGLATRIDLFLALPDARLTYDQFADLARTADEFAFGEIQSWQAVFSGKRTTVPA
ncbi:MAG: hypothetical protein AAGE86_01340 [Pseudomonadota bacterium]